MSRKSKKVDPISRKSEQSPAKPRTSFLQAVILILFAVVLFFGLLEGGLALLGVKPVTQTEDPFVGFAANVPLFVPAQGSDPPGTMVTAANKLRWFNKQAFPREKATDAYRIFCLGGSTTYGRPYSDLTSFAGWLRELLPAADQSKTWEVINAGGISYASYRVAHLMEELITYQPDLFIIYTGHNEFLEERTYRELRETPALIQSAASLLAQTRTWTMMNDVLQSAGLAAQSENADRDTLSAEVDTRLGRSIGPESYTRDDPLRRQVLEHYRISLGRMVELAQTVGAQVLFVTPASNLKDSSPFKSEHTDNLTSQARQQAEELLLQARSAIQQEAWKSALALLDKAIAIDPRNAELHYRRGKVLLALNRDQEAAVALRRARDEDVCPLRALTPMREIVTEVAQENGVPCVDYVGLLAQRMQSEFGQPVPGKELFLDHVHPTIEGHKILALALIRAMDDQGLVRPGTDWGQPSIDQVTQKIEDRVDQETQGQALANLARVLFWAGKEEEANRLANQAMKTAGNALQVAINATDTLVKYSLRHGELEHAHRQLNAALASAPGAAELHLKLGKLLGKRPYLQLARAAAHLLWSCQQMPNNDAAYQLFGQAMAWRGRPRIAASSLRRALQINPKNTEADKLLAQIKPLLGETPPILKAGDISVERYPDGTPSKLVQWGQDGKGQTVADGIRVEFHANGRVKQLVDMDRGAQNGMQINWDDSGRIVSLLVPQQGHLVDLERARQQLYSALAEDPGSFTLRLQLGKVLMNPPFLQIDEAAAHLLLACQKQPESDEAFQLFGQAMIRRGRPDIAYTSLRQALQLNPDNQVAQKTLTGIGPLLQGQSLRSAPPRLQLESGPTGAPRKLVPLRQLADGRNVPDGIVVEYHRNGWIKRLVDFDKGVQNGLEMAWDENGRLLSCAVFLQGVPAYGKFGD
jgi:tetratricopeptide (TPR) repeat protein